MRPEFQRRKSRPIVAFNAPERELGYREINRLSDSNPDRSLHGPRPAFDRLTRSWWPLAGAIVLGIVVRLYVAAALDGKAFNDTAIVGLMAIHELAGRFYAFY